MPYEILSAVLADAPAILALQRLAYQAEALRYNDWDLPPLTQPLEALEAEFKRLVILKAMPAQAPTHAEDVPGAHIVGSVRAGLSHGVCQIGRLIVHPEHQRQGLGSTLLAAIERRFPAAEKYALFTGARSEGNLRLYLRQGYAVVRSQEMSPELTLVFLEKPGPAAGAVPTQDHRG